MSYLKKHGAQLISAGYHIVPIRPGAKAPAIPEWQNCRADDALLGKWLGNGLAESGIGVLTADTPAIDIDCLDKDVSYKLVKWVENNIGKAPIRIGKKPKALMVFRTDEPFGKIRSNEYVDILGNKNAVEVLGKGQQFVAFHVHPETGQPYEWHKKNIVNVLHDDLPTITREQAQEFVAYFESIVPDDWELSRKGVSATYSDDDDLLTLRPKLGKSADQLEQWLESLDPDCGHDEWVRVGMALHHETDGSPEGLRLWDHWSSGGGKYVHGECSKRWRSFGRNPNQAPITASYIEGKAKKVERTEKQKGLVERLCQELVFVQVAGSARVIREDEFQDDLALYGVEDLTKEYANQCIPIEVEKKNGEVVIEKVNPIKLWLTHSERRTARGLVFLPEGQKVGAYNLWRGWSCEPEEGDVTRFTDWVHDIIADRDDDNAKWILGWCAQMIQEPMTKPGVAMVLRGLKGTGKSKLGELLGGLFPEHHKVISRQDQLVGHFNAHLEDCLLLQAEEAFWAGSKSAEGALKDLVTNQRLFIERKGVNGYMAPNFTRLLFTSNEEWVVPATADERRWAVFDISDRRKQDEVFYESLQNWYDRGGKKHLLHYFKTFDLSGVSIRRAPQTQALQQQQMMGGDCVQRWLFDCLMEGEIRDAKSGAVLRFGDYEANKATIYEAYRNSNQRNWEVKSANAFWTTVARYDDLFFNTRQKTAAGARYRVCNIASLDEARRLFCAKHQFKVDWPAAIATEE